MSDLRRKANLGLAGLAFWLLASGCVAGNAGSSAVRPGDSLFEKEAYGNAAAVYERYLRRYAAGREHDRVLFRLALTYLLRADSGRSPEQAYAVLQRLLRDRPDSEYRHLAGILVEQLQERVALQAQLDRLRHERASGDRRNIELREQLEKRQLETQVMMVEVDRLQKERDELNRELEALKAQLVNLQRKNTELAHELDELKKIDMQRAP